MNYNDIQKKVIEIIATHPTVAGLPVSLEDRLIDDLGVDSLDACEIEVLLEKEFNVPVSFAEDMTSSVTVKHIVDHIAKKVK